MIIATLEIRKTKAKAFGRIEVHEPDKSTPLHYGLYYFIGPYSRGFTPVSAKLGRDIAIAKGIRAATPFARQNACKYVYRADSPNPLRKV